MRILRRSTFKASRWKNGGGVTHEILRVPADGTVFDWRLSVAHIGAPGPFSDFTGYRRTLMLLDGEGLRLLFSDGTRAELRESGAMLEFDGAQAAHVELLGGPCRDLNLIVSMSLPPAEISIDRLAAPLTLAASATETCAVFCMDGSVVVAGADAADADSADELLHAGDVVVMSGGSLNCRAADPGAAPRVFRARLAAKWPPSELQVHK